MIIYLQKSTDKKKKYMVKIDNKIIHFGATGYSDYTKHKDKDRKIRYIKRHRNNEDWTASGMKTAGFWSFWLLWNEPTLSASIKHLEKKFKIKIRKI